MRSRRELEILAERAEVESFGCDEDESGRAVALTHLHGSAEDPSEIGEQVYRLTANDAAAKISPRVDCSWTSSTMTAP